MSIQSNLNQALTVGALLMSQTATGKANKQLAEEVGKGKLIANAGKTAVTQEQAELNKASFGAAPEAHGEKVGYGYEKQLEGLQAQYDAYNKVGKYDKAKEIKSQMDELRSKADINEAATTPIEQYGTEAEEYFAQEANKEFEAMSKANINLNARKVRVLAQKQKLKQYIKNLKNEGGNDNG